MVFLLTKHTYYIAWHFQISYLKIGRDLSPLPPSFLPSLLSSLPHSLCPSTSPSLPLCFYRMCSVT